MQLLLGVLFRSVVSAVAERGGLFEVLSSMPETEPCLLPPSFPTTRYEVKRLIGEGSRKKVFLAHDARLDRDVAVALIKTEGLDDVALDRVQREAREMGRLGDHPNIVTVFDIGDADGQPFIVTQLMPGGDVKRLLEQSEGHRLPIVRAITIAEQVAGALEHAHRLGVVHRDVKPDNVWLTESGAAHLGDFGLAVSSQERTRLTSEGVIVGTFAYMAPEQALGQPPEPRSDLYSLGSMLYEMVTGRPPFVGDDPIAIVSQHINAAPVAPSWHNPKIPTDLEAVILRLLAKAAGDRPSDAAVVRVALTAIARTPRSQLKIQEYSENPISRLAGGIFVGRAKEVEELRADVMKTLSGHGRLVLLGGEPGIGKTSVAQEVATYARLAGVQVLWGRCDDTGGAPPYWPWVQIIRSYVHDSGGDLASVMGSGAADIAQVVPEVATELSQPSPPMPLDSDQARFRLFDSISTFLRNAGRRQPLLLIFDDLHAADKSSLLLLQFLTRQVGDMHVMVVASYRDVEVARQHPLFQVLGELVRESVTRRLTLRGLAERDVERYIELSSGEPPSQALVEGVFRETEGNPFFVGEVVRLLVSEGRLQSAHVQGIWRSELPQGIREVIGRRLDRLSPECNRVLALGSVVGREFGINLLERASDSPRDQVLDALEEAVAARVITEVPLTAGRYAFAHGLFRETLYGELSTTRRVQLHRRVGEGLEAICQLNPEPHLAELAYHFFEAAQGGNTEKALHYSLRAGDRATEQMAHEDAARHYETALQVLEVTAPGDGGRLVDVLLKLSEALWRAGEVQRAKETSLRAIDITRRLGASEQLARAALALAGRLPAFGAVQRDETVIALLEEALAALPTEDSSLRARAMARLAEEQTLTESHEGRWSLSRQAVEMARRVDDPVVLASVLRCTFFASWDPFQLDERQSLSNEIIRVADEVGDRTLALEGRIFRFLGVVESGDGTEAARQLAVCARMAKELRQPYHDFVVVLLRGCMCFVEGRLDEVERIAQEGLVLGERAQTQNGPLFCGVQLGRLMWLRGRFHEVEPMLIGFGAMYPFLSATVAAALAATYTEQGRRDDAIAALDRIGPDPAAIPRHIAWQATVAFLAEAVSTVGDAGRAERLYELIRPLDGRNLMLPPSMTLGAAAYYLGLLSASLDRWEQAIEHFEDALEMDSSLGAIQHLARTQVAYAELLLRRGEVTDESRALQMLGEAEAAATRLGMTSVVERAHELAVKINVPASMSSSVRTAAESSGTPTEAAAQVSDVAKGAEGGETVVFRREGEYWTIVQGEVVIRLKDVKGLHYLAHLLSHPGHEFHALEVVSAAEEPGSGTSDLPAARSGGGHILDQSDPGALLDETAKNQYRARLAALREQLEEAESFHDNLRADAIREEIDAIAKQISEAVGLGGRDRSTGSSAERARWTVTKGIKSAVRKIRKGNPTLGRHLATQVRTGHLCCYDPDPDRPIRWVF